MKRNMLSFVMIAAGVFGGWAVEPLGKSVNSLSWWGVSHSGVQYAQYSCEAYATSVAVELGTRRLGPYWWRGMSGDKALAIQDEVSRAAFARVPPVPLDEQRKWWAERTAKP